MPQDNDDPNPLWGAKNKSPPDLDKILSQSIRDFKKFLPGGSPSKFLILTLVFLFGALIWTSLFTVPSDSVAVIQRFGKYTQDVPPGLHFKFPLGIDSATIVPVKRQLKQEFGFFTPGATDPFQSPRKLDTNRETQMVTGDLNAALVEWVVQYRISDPVKYLFEPVKRSDMCQSRLCVKSWVIVPLMK